MKKGIKGRGFILLLILPLWISCGGKYTEKPGNTVKAANLLPGDGDIRGWKRSGEMLIASNERELYQYLNGGAGLYISYGFQSYAGQLYTGPKGLTLEMAIYDQGSAKNAMGLYQDRFIKPSPSKLLDGPGEKARIDESGLFHYSVEFIQGRFFARVIIKNKTEEGLNMALLFARYASDRIR